MAEGKHWLARGQGALSRLTKFIDGDDEADRAEPFDPDAAIARYLANRPDGRSEDSPPIEPRAFGRKGL